MCIRLQSKPHNSWMVPDKARWRGDVEVVRQGERAVLVLYEDVEEWVPHSLIVDGSEVDENSDEGTTGELVIPLWKAKQLGWE